MLSSLIRSTLVAATLLGSFSAATAAPREAAGVTLIDHRGERHHRHDRWEHRGPRHGDRWEREARRGGSCSPRLALRKARDMGVRGADIVRDNRRAVVVAGHKRGHPTAVRFAQARGCPVIGYR
ncbi:hypothetical protein D3218_07035 [Aureimonas flava]|uniref:Antifreeze protein n=1 Tax=Aureimonas flava TaxID=2320271 RepID=A0A3A1WMG6_9HYPH|nr:hypothetical protein [Aureimonas flava]RIY02051.1 hypothetical protein D3218_07035 [Aureimonas flava]